MSCLGSVRLMPEHQDPIDTEDHSKTHIPHPFHAASRSVPAKVSRTYTKAVLNSLAIIHPSFPGQLSFQTWQEPG